MVETFLTIRTLSGCRTGGRNIVRGGFFFNDSVIALADYSDGERDTDVLLKTDESEIKDVSEYPESEESELYSEYLDNGNDSRDIVKVGSDL